jgi:hypothetical protein
MYLPTLSAVGHKSSMDHLFNDQIPHKSSVGHLFRCVSSFSYSGPTQVLYGSLASMWITYSSLISSHTSPLWAACFGVDHLFFSYQFSHKSSMGRLFRCGSYILLLSGLTQVLCGSLVSVWILYSSLIRSDTSPLWVTCSLLYVYAP